MIFDRLSRRATARSGLLLMLAFAAVGCNSSKHLAGAEQGVTTFHTQLDQGQFATIYDASDEAFQKADTRDASIAFLSKVHRSLGNVANATRETFFINFNTSGTFVTLTYKTAFANDAAVQENFVFRIENDLPKLVNYHVNSDVLMKEMTQ